MRKIIKLFSLLFVIALLFTLMACKKDDKVNVEFNELEKSELEVGSNVTVSLTINAKEYNVSYSSSDETIATVSEDGVISALKEGNATINVSVVINDELFKRDYNIKVTDNRTFTVTFDLDGGKLDIADYKIKVNETYTLPSPTKDDYEFIGWKLNMNDDSYVRELKGVMEDITVYACYKAKGYTVTYNLDGGVLDNKVEFVKKGETLELSAPTKAGYKFMGWTVTETSKEYTTKVENISSDVELYAHYDVDVSVSNSEIAYYLNGGSLNYKTREDVIADFIKDLNKTCGKSYADANAMGTSLWAPTDFWDDFFLNKQMNAKWKWMLEFIVDNAGTSTNKQALQKILNGGTVSGESDPYSVSYEFRAFLQGTSYRATSSTYGTKDYSDTTLANSFWSYLSKNEEKVYAYSANGTLYTPTLYSYDFAGWYKDALFTDGPYKKQEAGCTYYAKWVEGCKVTSVVINNNTTEVKVYDKLQLDYTVNPSNANIKDVKFYSSDEHIAKVDKDGLIQTLGSGKVTITVKSLSASGLSATIELDVYKPSHFEISYETNSYVEQDNNIKLNATYINRDNTNDEIVWTSLNTDIATVDKDGNVTGVKEGLATIQAKAKNANETIDFVVTVLSHEQSEELQFVLESHNSNAKNVYNLGIGSGTPEYYYDITGSVSKLIFDEFKVDRTYYDKLPEGTKNNGTMSSVEFITVHYTGNMNYSADADNNCDYFNNLGYAASIHYVTGRSNLYGEYSEDEYYAFAGLNEKYGGWHASDSSKGKHEWIKSGVKVSDSDPSKPVISISSNSKYTINGVETTITIPERNDGIKVTGPTFVYNGITCNSINDMGIAWTIIDGEYYLGNTWWGPQAYGYTLSNIGGNYNSIGIESCVDKGSDLIHTWHVTAQLVADLMYRYNLSIDRVQGHHFFSGKDCPQPMLENNMELWYYFLDMVQAEYDLLVKKYTVSMEVVNGEGVLSNKGLLTQDDKAHVVTYKVKINNNGKEEEITLATALNSYYSCNCERDYTSLQIEGYEVK